MVLEAAGVVMTPLLKVVMVVQRHNKHLQLTRIFRLEHSPVMLATMVVMV